MPRAVRSEPQSGRRSPLAARHAGTAALGRGLASIPVSSLREAGLPSTLSTLAEDAVTVGGRAGRLGQRRTARGRRWPRQRRRALRAPAQWPLAAQRAGPAPRRPVLAADWLLPDLRKSPLNNSTAPSALHPSPPAPPLGRGRLTIP